MTQPEPQNFNRSAEKASRNLIKTLRFVLIWKGLEHLFIEFSPKFCSFKFYKIFVSDYLILTSAFQLYMSLYSELNRSKNRAPTKRDSDDDGPNQKDSQQVFMFYILAFRKKVSLLSHIS